MDSTIKDHAGEHEVVEALNRSTAHPDLISFKHINVRQSIFLLLLKLIIVEVIAVTVVIVFHTAMFVIKDYQSATTPIIPFNVYVFMCLAVLKMLLTGYIILGWYDEYYEISATMVGHKKGFFVKRHEQVKLEHLTSVKLEQGLLGRLFNCGTIRVHDWFRNKDYYLYQIHNPKKYERVLVRLMPTADHSSKTIRDRIIEEEKE